jgi:pimeloyl-ACP methyl ester carboxylesterase
MGLFFNLEQSQFQQLYEGNDSLGAPPLFGSLDILSAASQPTVKPDGPPRRRLDYISRRGSACRIKATERDVSKMPKNEELEQQGNQLDRRRFLGGVSMAAIAAPVLGAAAWPKVAAADEEQGDGSPPRKGRRQSTDEFTRGAVQANGLNFHYIERGKGPLALCLHGFPDSPFTYRYLMPYLSAAGYRAVSPWNRGYYPTDAPEPPQNYHVQNHVDDVIALKAALGGNEEAVLIGYNVGAMAAWGVGSQAPDAFRSLVIQGIPPFPLFIPNYVDYQHIRRAHHFAWLQMPYSSEAYSAHDYEFAERLWEDWSPGYDHTEDTKEHKKVYLGGTRQEHVLGATRNLANSKTFRKPAMIEEHTKVWGQPVPNPVLYMHGANDGFFFLEDKVKDQISTFIPHPSSRIEIVEGVGHFMNVEAPELVSRLIVDFLAEGPGIEDRF